MGAKLGGGGRRQRRAHGVMSEINVTPFVDVMLVLLVIFMITAPLLSAGLTVELPKADASALAQQDSSPIEVTMDQQGNIYVGENKVTQDRLVTMLQAISDETKDRKVYLKADQRLDYGKVFEMMALTRKMGFTVALVSEPSTSRK